MTSYYPATNDGRADWWQNIIDNQGSLTTAGLPTGQVTAITVDAQWGIYLYRTVRKTFEDFEREVIAYANGYTGGADGGAPPVPPPVPAWPPQPSTTSGINTGLEKRREKWVQQLKALPGCSATIAATLKVVAPGDSFDPATYKAELFGMSSPSAHTVAGKFRKANGNVEGIHLYGRKAGTTAMTLLRSLSAVPFSALVPVTAASGPENWEFQARAVIRDAEIGLPSDIVPVTVQG